jgi:hypothetical protein
MQAFLSAPAPRVARRWRVALSLSNEHYRGLLAVLDRLSLALDWAHLPVARRKRLLASAGWHATAMVVASLARRVELRVWGEQVHDESAALFAEGVAPQPWVSGQDLIDAGLKPGPMFRRWLDEVYDAQLEGHVADRQDALLALHRLAGAQVNDDAGDRR